MKLVTLSLVTCIITITNACMYGLDEQRLPLSITVRSDTSYMQKNQQGLRPLFLSLSSSIVPSAIIGAFSGFGCRACEKRFLNRGSSFLAQLLIWAIFSISRGGIVKTIAQTMSEHDVDHSDPLMQTTAWAADWLTYLLVS